MLSIIVVDDEISTLNGICHILRRHPEEFHIVCEATSALKALEALETHKGNVDVVITDVRMPVMSGVQLVEIIAQRYPMVRTIVLSAHSDYDYVRACLRHGAVDYLLKPCRYKVLLSTLRRVGGEKTSREQLRVLKSTHSRLKDVLLSRDGVFPPDLPFASAYLLYMQSGSEASALLEKLRDCVTYHLEIPENEGHRYYALEMDDGCLLFIDDALLPPDKKSAMKALYQGVRPEYADVSMAYALLAKGDALLPCIRRCRALCDFSAFNALERPVSIEERNALYAQVVPSGFSAYWTQGAISKLLQEDAPRLEKGFARLLKGFSWPEGYLDPNEIKREAVRLLFSLEQNNGKQAHGPDDISDSYTEYTERVRRTRHPSDLMAVIQDYLRVMNAHFSKKGSGQPRYIVDAIKYIRAHYMDNVQLSDVAHEVFLNEWYFSSQFKKHMGVSFKEFLNGTRIETAKRLLGENDLKVGQIAEMVGFSDATYFATSFKYSTGRTPKEYRKTLQTTEGNGGSL